MKTILRTTVRHILGFLTRLTIKKHHSTVIAIIGNGETSVAREILYENIHQRYPARRNLEILEAEFSMPLTVLGILTYPSNIVKWPNLIMSSLLKTIYLKPNHHFLIIEIPEINKKIINFWLTRLTPQYILILGKSKYTPKLSQKNIYSNTKAIFRKIGIKETIKELPQPRIKILKGIRNATIIDAASYYTPPPIKSVLEILDKKTKGRIILFSDLEKDSTVALKAFPSAIINPKNLEIQPTDILIIRGNKLKTQNLLNKFINHP